jgi:hypothetical protein
MGTAESKYTEEININIVKKPFAGLTAEEKADIEFAKSNSTSTMYVNSTISVPDVDRILLSVGLLLEQMIEEPPPGKPRPVPEILAYFIVATGPDLFNPPPTLASRRPSKKSARRCSARDIYRFMKKSFVLALW